MVHRFSKILAVAIVALFVVSSVGFAASEMLSGTIQKMDAARGTVTIQAANGKSVQLLAAPELLAGLQEGDAVAVRRSGPRATVIQKQMKEPKQEKGR